MKFAAIFLILTVASASATAQTTERPLRIAIMDFGDSATARRVNEKLSQGLAPSVAGQGKFQVIDRDRARAAATGIGYQGSLNLTLSEARDLGSVIGCDFFLTGIAETLRRSPADGTIYFESYAAIYLVSTRTGKLILWDRPSLKLAKPEEAEKLLLEKLAASLSRYQKEIYRALEDERAERAHAVETPPPVIEEAPDEAASATNGLRLPRPYRRLIPPYPLAAAESEAEAVVDVLVDVDVQGEVGHIEIARWAGYDLDQSVVDTVKKLHFFPAMRDGVAIPLRVLLRYNFRKPSNVRP